MDYIISAPVQDGAQFEPRPQVDGVANPERTADDSRRVGSAPEQSLRIAGEFRLMAGADEINRQAEHLTLAAGKIALRIDAENPKPS